MHPGVLEGRQVMEWKEQGRSCVALLVSEYSADSIRNESESDVLMVRREEL